MAQILVPVSDVDTGSFSPTPLWSKVDDDSTVNPSGDGTEIQSADNSADQADFLLSTGTDPDSSSGHVLRARWYRSQAGNHNIHGELELWQGVPGTGTLIASLVSAQPIETSEVEDTYTLSTSEADAITDYSDLHLRLIRQGGTGGNPNGRESLNVDLIEFEVPGLSRAGQVSHAELETTDAPTSTDRRSQIAHAELEAPSNIGTGYVHLNQSGTTGHMGSDDTGTHNLDIGEFEIIAIVAADTYSNGNGQPIISKYNSGSADGGYMLTITGTGALQVEGYNTGATLVTFTSTSGLLVSNGEPLWIRATYEVDTGADEARVNFYTSEDPIDTEHTAVTWTQLGNTVSEAGQDLPWGHNDLDARIGISLVSGFFGTPFEGKIHGVWVYDAPSGGTLVANPDFRNADQGWDSQSSGTDDQGVVWDFRNDVVWEPGDRTGQISHAEVEVPSATNDRGVQISYSELETTDPPRAGQVSHAELETEDAPRAAQASFAELEAPTAPRQGQLSFAELEVSDPPARGQVSFTELETPDGPRAGQISHAELETADAPRQGQISFAELETEDAARSGQVSFTELEAPTPPRQGQVSYATLEAPDAPTTDRRGQLAFAELETADAGRQAQIAHAEVETGDAPRQAQLSFTELETADAPRSAQLAHAELEAEDAPRAGQLSHAELETQDAPRSGQVSFAELETATAPRHAQLSFAELEAPTADREGQVSYATLETPDAPTTDRRGQIAFTEIETPDGPRSAQVSHAEMEAEEAPRSAEISYAAVETDDAPRSAQIAFAEVETEDAARRLGVSYAALETDDAPRAAQVAFTELEAPAEPRRAEIAFTELETPTAPRSAEVSHAEFTAPEAGLNRRAEIAYAAVEAPFRPFGLPAKERHETGRNTRARRLRNKLKHRTRYNRHRSGGR